MTTIATKRAKKRTLHVSDKYRRTISIELFTQWRNSSRKGDPQLLMDHLKATKPTINKALIYGHANSQKLIDGITQFFADRYRKELDAAEELQRLRKRSEQLQERGVAG